MSIEPHNIASRYLQRRVLLLSLLPLGLLFVVTVTLARTYHAREEGLVRQWFESGNVDLTAGHPLNAIADYRNALSYDPENKLVQLRLAEALLAAGRLEEARSYFVTLWEAIPGSGEVNLDLAHLAQRTADTEQAIRYFRNAIYGSWDSDPARQRRSARLELCELLLQRGQFSEAQAELAGLAADTPPEEANLHEEIGRLFLRAGDPKKALQEFEAILPKSQDRGRMLELAGKAAYDAGEYTKAQTYLAAANRESPSDEIAGLLGTTRRVLRNDPFTDGIRNEEQVQRSWRAFHQGLTRLQKCVEMETPAQAGSVAPSDLQALVRAAQDLKSRITLASLRAEPDLRDDAMHFVFQVEESTSQTCGTPGGDDLALMLIAKRHSGNNP